MEQRLPCVTVTLPVYNGERFVGAALEGLLAQTLEDFELVISDNASTDATEEICRAVAGRDPRVRYVRHQVNHGLVWNHQFTLDQARGRYFFWAHHDDLHAPEYLQRCVEVMEGDPGVARCNTRTLVIDEHGQPVEHLEGSFSITSTRPHERLRDVIGLGDVHYFGPRAFGVFRTSMLRALPRLSTHVAWDRALLAELSLHGRFVELPEELFLYRTHPQQASSTFQTRAGLSAWHDPSKANRIVFPNFRLGLDYLHALRRSPFTGAERRRCYAVLARWPVHYRRLLALDLLRAGPQASALARRAVPARRAERVQEGTRA